MPSAQVSDVSEGAGHLCSDACTLWSHAACSPVQVSNLRSLRTSAVVVLIFIAAVISAGILAGRVMYARMRWLEMQRQKLLSINRELQSGVAVRLEQARQARLASPPPRPSGPVRPRA